MSGTDPLAAGTVPSEDPAGERLVWFLGGTDPAGAYTGEPIILQIGADPAVLAIMVEAAGQTESVSTSATPVPGSPGTWTATLTLPSAGVWDLEAQVRAVSQGYDLTDARRMRAASRSMRVEAPASETTRPQPLDGSATQRVAPGSTPWHPRPAALDGAPIGGGGGVTEPDITITDCAVQSPGAGATVSSGLTEPGASFTVTVYAAAQEVTYNPDGTANPPETIDVTGVTVTVQDASASHSYVAVHGGLGSWTATCRAFRSGPTTLTATAEYTARAANISGSPKVSAPVQVTVALMSDTPSLQVTAPAQGFQVVLDQGGGRIDVAAKMADATVFGARSVTVLPDSGPNSPVALSPVAGSTTQYAGTVYLNALPFPARSLQVVGSCADAPEHPTDVTVTGTGIDTAPPDDVRVTSPALNGGQVQVAGTAPNFTVTIIGTAHDLQSGMVGGLAAVAVALAADAPPAQRTAAAPLRNPGDLRDWTATLPVPPNPPPGTAPPSLGAFTVYIWATDAAGNTTAQATAWTVDPVNVWQPPTLDDRLSPVEYLQDLIAFTKRTVGGWEAVAGQEVFVGLTATGLATLLAQPIAGISATPPNPAVQESINELRVPIEVLRTHMARQTPPISADTAGQSAYLWIAYQAVLAQIGTSYTELREARAAKADQRNELADRLGIPLYQLSSGTTGRTDQLDAITLTPASTSSPGTLTEQSLQTLFGIAPTAPFDPAQPQPAPSASRWHQWQLERQRALWRAQDQKPPVPVAYTVVVDPDVITRADVTADPAQAANVAPVISLLTDRANQLDAMAGTLRSTRAAHASDPDAGLAALLSAANLGVNVAALHAQDVQGSDISGPLTAAGLDRTGFAYLVQLQTLVGADAAGVAAAEWDDAISVLTGAYRRRDRYPVWLAEEQNATPGPIVLSPDVFAAGEDPPADPLRVDPRARRDWLQTLRSRTLQRKSLNDGSAALVTAAESTALPVLRDALLADIAAAMAQPGSAPDPTAAGEMVTDRYQIDVLVSGALSTTRVEQAITSLQTLIQQVRSGAVIPDPDLPGNQPLGLLSTDGAWVQTFDGDWTWIGTYDGWRAATTTFLFPEAYLDPERFTRRASAAPTTAYQTLLSDLSGSEVDDPIAAYMSAIGAVVRYVLASDSANLDFGALTYDRSMLNVAAMEKISERMEQHDPGLAVEVFWAVPMLAAQRLRAERHYQEALDWLWLVGSPTDSTFDRIVHEAADNPAQSPPDLTLPPQWPHLTLPELIAGSPLDPFTLVTSPMPQRPFAFQRATLLAIAGCLLEWADVEFTAESDESIAHARTLYRSALGLLDPTRPPFRPLNPVDPRDAALVIPQAQALRSRAASQLDKIRQDRNIAGLQRTQAQSGGGGIRQATPYHFKTLLARAQQLAQQASGVEAQFLSAAEKFAAQRLAESDAHSGLDLAGTQLTVHDAQIQQARDGVAVAQAQRAKAADAVSTLTAAINAPLSRYEQNLLQNYDDLRDAQQFVNLADMSIGVAQAAAGAVTSFGISVGEIAGYVGKYMAQRSVTDLQAQIQSNQLLGSIDDRRRQLQLQLASAQQDMPVATAQLRVANDQAATAVAERAVAALQVDQAATHLKLLLGQFTNSDLYQWLSATLNEVYRYFLQNATAVARLAEAQLAFERAEPARSYIRGDYWQPLTPPPTGNTRGLTGAEQLTEDLAKLDDYAFRTDTRRLNITQSFSLAALAPLEFLDFKRTGQFVFTTPTALFDQDFPGHYHRLIRQARLSVIALVPPGRGIRATLVSNGISRVVTENGDAFGEVLLRRDPTVVGLTSPVDASGVFAVDLQPDMLLPFEGSGVDTTWELLMPPAANPFDFGTISDVVLTIDYTALTDFGYQTEVVRQLNADRTRGGDAIFSLARDFPDAWYALHNPDPTAPSGTPSTATMTLRAADFPATIDPASLTTTNIAVRLIGASGTGGVSCTVGHGGAAATPVTDATGTASTRRGADWGTALEAVGPVGDWTLSFETATAKTIFGVGGLDDIVLIVSWSGIAPAWPS